MQVADNSNRRLLLCIIHQYRILSRYGINHSVWQRKRGGWSRRLPVIGLRRRSGPCHVVGRWHDGTIRWRRVHGGRIRWRFRRDYGIRQCRDGFIRRSGVDGDLRRWSLVMAEGVENRRALHRDRRLLMSGQVGYGGSVQASARIDVDGIDNFIPTLGPAAWM